MTRVLFLMIFTLWLGCDDTSLPAAPADTTPPGEITDLDALALTDSTVLLRWTAPGDDGFFGTVASYTISERLRPYHGLEVIRTIAGPAPHVPNSLELIAVNVMSDPAPHVYEYTVTARDEAGNASNSNKDLVSFTDMVPPDAVSTFTASGQSSSVIAVYWNPSDVSERLDLRMATSIEGILSPAASRIPADGHWAYVGALEHFRRYYFIVRRRDHAGNWSIWSPVVSAMTWPRRLTGWQIPNKIGYPLCIGWDPRSNEIVLGAANGLHRYSTAGELRNSLNSVDQVTGVAIGPGGDTYALFYSGLPGRHSLCRFPRNTSDCDTLASWGGGVNEIYPVAIAIDGNSNLYVPLRLANTVVKYNPTGDVLDAWPVVDADQDFVEVAEVATDGVATVFVTCYTSSGTMVYAFTAHGRLLNNWRTGIQNISGSIGADAFGHVFVRTPGRVTAFRRDGTELLGWTYEAKDMTIASGGVAYSVHDDLYTEPSISGFEYRVAPW